MLVHTVQPVGQPGTTDLKKSQAQFWKSLRYSLEDHVGELNEDSHWKRYRVDFGEGLETTRSQLIAAIGTVHGNSAIQTLCFTVNRIIESMSERQTQPCGAHDGRAIAQLLYRATQFYYSTLGILR